MKRAWKQSTQALPSTNQERALTAGSTHGRTSSPWSPRWHKGGLLAAGRCRGRDSHGPGWGVRERGGGWGDATSGSHTQEDPRRRAPGAARRSLRRAGGGRAARLPARPRGGGARGPGPGTRRAVRGQARTGAGGGGDGAGRGVRAGEPGGPGHGRRYSLGVVGEAGAPRGLVAVQVTVEHIEAEAAHLGRHHHLPATGPAGTGAGGGEQRGGRRGEAGGAPAAAGRQRRGEGAAGGAPRQPPKAVEAGAPRRGQRPRLAPRRRRPTAVGAAAAASRAGRARGRGTGEFLLLHPAATRRHLGAVSPHAALPTHGGGAGRPAGGRAAARSASCRARSACNGEGAGRRRREGRKNE